MIVLIFSAVGGEPMCLVSRAKDKEEIWVECGGNSCYVNGKTGKVAMRTRAPEQIRGFS